MNEAITELRRKGLLREQESMRLLCFGISAIRRALSKQQLILFPFLNLYYITWIHNLRGIWNMTYHYLYDNITKSLHRKNKQYSLVYEMLVNFQNETSLLLIFPP